MFEAPEIIRLNIQHLQALLRRHDMGEKRQRIMKLLKEAEAELPLATAEVERKRSEASRTKA